MKPIIDARITPGVETGPYRVVRLTGRGWERVSKHATELEAAAELMRLTKNDPTASRAVVDNAAWQDHQGSAPAGERDRNALRVLCDSDSVKARLQALMQAAPSPTRAGNRTSPNPTPRAATAPEPFFVLQADAKFTSGWRLAPVAPARTRDVAEAQMAECERNMPGVAHKVVSFREWNEIRSEKT